MDKPYVVGVTGGIACGKTGATDYLAAHGGVVVDADSISRDLTAPNGAALPAIRERFGDGVFHEDGTLDRAAMGRLVFSDIQKRRELEGIIHPMVQHSVVTSLRDAGANGIPLLFLSVPLLFETGMDTLCDETWCMSVGPDEQLRRVMERDGLSRAEAQARIDSQMPLAEKERRATLVIHTDRPVELTRAELQALLLQLRRKLS